MKWEVDICISDKFSSYIICDRNSITSALRQVWTLRLDFNPIKESFCKSTFLSDVIHYIVDHSDAEFALKKKIHFVLIIEDRRNK